MELLKKYRKQLILFLFINVFFSIPLFYRIDYRATMPGGLTQVERLIEIDSDHQTTGSFNTTFVLSFNRITMFQHLFYTHNSRIEVNRVHQSQSHFTARDHNIMGQISMNASIELSIIVAYRYAQKALSYDVLGFILAHHPEGFDFFGLGAMFTNINGVTGAGIREVIVNAQQTDILNITYTYFYDTTKEYQISIQRSALNGTRIETKYGNFVANPAFTVNRSNSGGPSGGLLQTLHNYDILTGSNLTRGLVIAGTGTINYDGSVGAIGGMRQKIYTAQKNRARIFLVPFSDDQNSSEFRNFQEALETYQSLRRPTFVLVPVRNFQEALEALRNDKNFL
ncbi:MAG: hypothetical protein FWE36_02695 [Erysipelotrichales bacterium]|nr:hypothetical protein [Erysipelotrichales bacterium]